RWTTRPTPPLGLVTGGARAAGERPAQARGAGGRSGGHGDRRHRGRLRRGERLDLVGAEAGPVVAAREDHRRLLVAECLDRLERLRVRGDVDHGVLQAMLLQRTIRGIALDAGGLAEDGDGHGAGLPFCGRLAGPGSADPRQNPAMVITRMWFVAARFSPPPHPLTTTLHLVAETWGDPKT